MEPERNIEKELRAYAARRRAEAGTQAGPDAVTRNLLRDEAARVTKGPAEEPRSGRLTFWGSWLRLAVAGVAVIAVIAMCTSHLLNSSRSRTEIDRLAAPMAKNAAKVQMAENQPQEEKLDSVSRRRQIENRPFGPATPAPMAAPVASLEAPVLAAPPVTLAAGSYDSSETNSLSLSSRSPERGTNAGTDFSWIGQKDYPGYSASIPAERVVQQFRKASAPQTAGGARVADGALNVLDSFRVEQLLGKLRVIDSDGSVYNGFVERTPETKTQAAKALDKLAADRAKSPTEDNKQKEPARMFRFRVIGTNRTLNEEVVFTGDFVNNTAIAPLKPAASSGQVGGSVAPEAAGGESLPLELRGASVAGQVLLGGTNQIEILAVPVKP